MRSLLVIQIIYIILIIEHNIRKVRLAAEGRHLIVLSVLVFILFLQTRHLNSLRVSICNLSDFQAKIIKHEHPLMNQEFLDLDHR